MTADWRIHRVVHDLPAGTSLWAQQTEMIEELKECGATFFRMTRLIPSNIHILVLEGWRQQTDDQGPEPLLEDVIGFGSR